MHFPPIRHQVAYEQWSVLQVREANLVAKGFDKVILLGMCRVWPIGSSKIIRWQCATAENWKTGWDRRRDCCIARLHCNGQGAN